VLIDWFTVVAQAINFLILVWLLKRYLYRPILHAIDERESGIAAQLAQAEAMKAESQKERDDFLYKNDAFDQDRAALLKRAADEANAERQRLLDQAREDADALRAKRQEALRNEQRSLNRDLARWTQKEVFAIARKTLADLAAASLEQRMAGVFVQRLRALTGTAKEQLAAGLKTSTVPVRVRSAFDLLSETRAAIQQALNETFSADIRIQFDTVPELVSGIELSANGQKVAWSIADQLANLEKTAGEILHRDSNGESDSGGSVSPGPKVNGKTEQKVVTNSAAIPKATTEPVPAALASTEAH
jgi:F-type H+-transporting ATPase subunit b